MPAIPPPNTKAAPTFLSFCCVMSYSSSNDLIASLAEFFPLKGLGRHEAKFGTVALMPRDVHQGSFLQVIQTQGDGVDGQAGLQRRSAARSEARLAGLHRSGPDGIPVRRKT